MVIREDELNALLQRSLDGDQGAYRQFLKLLSAILRTYLQRQLYRVGRAEHDAEDLVQETLLAIHGKWHTYERDIPVTAWARAIARYKLIDSLRKSTKSAHDRSIHDIEDTAVAYETDIDSSLSVVKLITLLPEKLRRSLELVRLNGFSANEVAAATGMSEAAIKVNVHRAARAIASGLKK